MKPIVKLVTNQTQLEDAFFIRTEVFVKEQGVTPAEEFDQFEIHADHIVVYEGEVPIGTARLRVVDGMAKLERICILAAYRQHGIGRIIVQSLEQKAKKKNLTDVKVHGQTQAQPFYEKLGYIRASDVFMEEGIEHVLMVKQLI